MLSVQKLADCTGHRAAVYALAPGHDARHFLTGGGDGWIVQWNMDDPANGRLLASVEDRIFSMCRLPEENRLVVGNMTGGVHWLDLDHPSRTRNVQHHINKGVFDILAAGQWVFTAGGDGFLTRWDAATGRALESLQISGQALRSLSFSEEHGKLAVGASDCAIYVLDIQTLKLTETIPAAHGSSVFSVLWSPDGRRLLSGGRDALLKIWDAMRGYEMIQEIPAHWYTINNMVWSPDGGMLATASRDKTVKIWDADSLNLLKVVDSVRHSGHINSVNRLLWQTEGLVSGSDDRAAIVWQIERGKNV